MHLGTPSYLQMMCSRAPLHCEIILSRVISVLPADAFVASQYFIWDYTWAPAVLPLLLFSIFVVIRCFFLPLLLASVNLVFPSLIPSLFFPRISVCVTSFNLTYNHSLKPIHERERETAISAAFIPSSSLKPHRHINPVLGLALQTQWTSKNWTLDNSVAIPFHLEWNCATLADKALGALHQHTDWVKRRELGRGRERWSAFLASAAL